MPRFPQLEQLTVAATFADYVPGKLHPDGRRYLPLLIFRLANGFELGVVDRHHLVQPEQVGQHGIAGLVFLLSTIQLQPAGQQRQGLVDQPVAGHVSTAPEAFGRVISVPSWEAERGTLSYESLYTELVLDVGVGIVGVRTSTTAADLAQAIGKPQIEPGDWIAVGRSRIDILFFRPELATSQGDSNEAT